MRTYLWMNTLIWGNKWLKILHSVPLIIELVILEVLLTWRPEGSPHTSSRWRVRELMSQPIIQLYRGMIRGPDWMSLIWARTPGEPLLFAISALGSFMTSVSQDLGFTSPPKDGEDLTYRSYLWVLSIGPTYGSTYGCYLLSLPIVPTYGFYNGLYL